METIEIKKVKKSGAGYMLNDNTYVPKDDSNKHYKAIKEWLETNEAEEEYSSNELEEKRINAIKVKAKEMIEAKYPLWKQLNIISSGGVEVEIMRTYIDSIRDISNSAESSGTNVDEIEWTK